jgi:hypothetical protein
MTPDPTSARAACEAGYLSLPAYLALCREHGWKPDPRLTEESDEHRDSH